MKKMKVMVLVVVFMLLAASAFAAIATTPHDLSTTGGGGDTDVKSTNYSEVCVFCHTPHGGNIASQAPLWNRTGTFNSYLAGELYNSATLEDASAPNLVAAAVERSDAKLCMSCHDGSSLVNGLRNPANTSSNAQPEFGANSTVGANADLGDDLTNDHPIGMDYAAAQATDAELKDVATLTLPLFADSGTAGDVMWCSSCHDVHDNDLGSFLLVSNASSALCTTCHIK